MSTIDLSDFETVETTTVELDDKHGNEMYHPAGNGERASVTIYGPGTKQYTQAESNQHQRAVKTYRTGKTDVDADKAAFLADITQSINHLGLKPEDQTRKAFYDFYMNQKIRFIRDKVNTAAGDPGNF